VTPLPSAAGGVAADSQSQPPEAQSRRAVELDALAAVLPLGSRDRLAELLSDGEVETLRHLAREGMGANTLRAMASDLAYLEAWSLAAGGGPLPWPAPEDLVLRFVAHHLYDPARRAEDRSHGMPDAVDGALRQGGRLRAGGPHAPATVRRRVALWSTFHRWLGLEGPFSSPSLRAALRLAARAARRPRGRKSAKPLTRDVLERLIAACAKGTLADKRDAALLLVAFASGGRRRSEIAGLRIEDLVERPPVPADPRAPQGPKLPVLALKLARTKTASREDDERVLAVGRPVEALKAWLAAAGISSGPVFRPIDRWGAIGDSALDGQSVNAIVKRRSALAGLDPAEFSAHGLRSGYLTEAARRGVPLPEAMRQSRHRSVQQAAAYYNEVEIERGRSARLV
jgi:integrase